MKEYRLVEVNSIEEITTGIVTDKSFYKLEIISYEFSPISEIQKHKIIEDETYEKANSENFIMFVEHIDWEW